MSLKRLGSVVLNCQNSIQQKSVTYESLLQLAAAASNKNTSNKDLKYPEIEELALQFILDTCEASISKYTKFLQVEALHFNCSASFRYCGDKQKYLLPLNSDLNSKVDRWIWT